MNEKAQRIFQKSILLLETRLGLKIKNAVLVIDTDFGVMDLHLEESQRKQNILLIQQVINKEIIDTITDRKVGGQIVNCSACSGSGYMNNDIYSGTACPKCKGGGQMYRYFNPELETAEETITQGA